MSIYIVSYELHDKKSQDYSRLIKAIGKLDHHKVQDSLWLVAGDSDIIDFASYLYEAVGDDDALWVCEITNRNFAHMNSFKGTEDFLDTRNFLSIFDEHTTI